MNCSRFWTASPLSLALVLVAPVLGADEKPETTQPRTAQPDATALQALKAQIDAMRSEYEKRIKELETRLEQLQADMLRAAPEPEAPAAAPVAQERGVQTIP